MFKNRLFSLIALCTVGVLGAAAGGCAGSAKVSAGATEPAAEPAPPPPAPTHQHHHRAFKAIGRARIVNNEIQIPGKIQFDLDKSTIRDSAETKEILDTLLQEMKDNPQITKLHIEGHTDKQGDLEHNNKLSKARADAVAAWLAGHGIDQSRIVTVGMGPSKPIASNDTEQGREQNRRTEFKIWEVDGELTEEAKAAGATK
ncbi:MAG: OmpA family protein [Polyangiaceae bacterium]|nr:OmpA family protein [Polyangiaceae bacterium]